MLLVLQHVTSQVALALLHYEDNHAQRPASVIPTFQCEMHAQV